MTVRHTSLQLQKLLLAVSSAHARCMQHVPPKLLLAGGIYGGDRREQRLRELAAAGAQGMTRSSGSSAQVLPWRWTRKLAPSSC